jgi:hypothetical protein
MLIVMKVVSMLTLFSLFYAGSALSCTASSDPEHVVQVQLEAYNARNIDLFASCHSADIKIKSSQKDAPDIIGQESLIKAYQFLKTAPKSFKVILENRIVNGPVVVDYERLTGLGNGRDDLFAVAVYEVRNGKIVNVWFPPTK